MYNNPYNVEWPYIPLALIWTLPAICVRIIMGRVVDKVLPESLESGIIVRNHLSPSVVKTKRIGALITCLASVAFSWPAVIVAYYTQPIGFFAGPHLWQS